MRPALDAMPYQVPPWSTRYPELARVLEDDPAVPRHNRITHNVAVRCPLIDVDPATRALLEIAGNVEDSAR
jgi:hypothetical protein